MPQPLILIAVADNRGREALPKFLQLARELRAFGHDAAFLELPDLPHAACEEAPKVSLEAATRLSWAAAMVGGSAFRPESLVALAQLRATNLGVRLQYVLDGQGQRGACRTVNDCFAPNVLVFSNPEWPVGSFTGFQADRFVVTADITSAERTLSLITPGTRRYYSYAPEADLWGKWPLEVRLHGLDSLLQETRGRTVIDFGSAEGLVAREFLLNGAARVDGFDVDAARIEDAKRLCSAFPAAEFRVADLADWRGFRRSHAHIVDGSYDIVLYLGLHQHLPPDSRLETLSGALQVTRDYFAIRTSEDIYQTDHIDELLARAHFHLVSTATRPEGHLGTARIYRKARAGESTG